MTSDQKVVRVRCVRNPPPLLPGKIVTTGRSLSLLEVFFLPLFFLYLFFSSSSSRFFFGNNRSLHAEKRGREEEKKRRKICLTRDSRLSSSSSHANWITRLFSGLYLL